MGDGALRLVFERVGNDVRLIEAIPLDVVVPPSDELKLEEDEAGFFVRLYDGNGNLVYRKAAWNPLGDEAEVWTGDPEQPWLRSEVERSHLTFELIVPDVDDEADVELAASPKPDAKEKHHRGPAKRLARFKIKHKKRNTDDSS